MGWKAFTSSKTIVCVVGEGGGGGGAERRLTTLVHQFNKSQYKYVKHSENLLGGILVTHHILVKNRHDFR
jgi:hypothetical protein